MAAGQTARKKLVGVLGQEASDPILRASSGGYPAADKPELEHAQGLSEGKRPPHRNEGARAEAVRPRFREGFTSSAAPQVERTLEGGCATRATRFHVSAETWR